MISESQFADLWTEVLGDKVSLDQGFLEAGGDSFRAVLLSMRMFDISGHEVDYLDVLEAQSAEAVRRLAVGNL